MITISVLKTYGSDTQSFKPSLTFKVADGHIQGTVDGLDAVAQAIDLMLSTERYRHLILSSDYGVEMDALIGARKSYIRGDMRRRLEEALKQDDRVIGIRNFSLEFGRECTIVSMTVQTVFGKVERRLEVG